MPLYQYLQIDIKNPHNFGKISGLIQDLIDNDVVFSIHPPTIHHCTEMLSSPGFSDSSNLRDSTSADSAFSLIQSVASSNGPRQIHEDGIVPNQEMHFPAASLPTNSLIPPAGHSLVDPTLPSAFNFGMFSQPAINVTDPRSLNMLFSGVPNNGPSVNTSGNVTKSSNPMGQASAGMPRRDSIDAFSFPLHQQLSTPLVPPNFCGHMGATTNATAQNQLAALRAAMVCARNEFVREIAQGMNGGTREMSAARLVKSPFCLFERKKGSSVRDTKYVPFTASQKENLKTMFDYDPYPAREAKEKIAAYFNVNFQKVDRYFAKQRSKSRLRK